MERGNDIWLLTLSDLLMLLTVFFVILFGMVLHGQTRPLQPVAQETSSKTSAAITPKEESKEEKRTPPVEMTPENVSATLESELSTLFEKEEEDGMTIKRQDQHLVLVFPEKIVFDPGQARLKPSVRAILGKVASYVLDHPRLLVEVQGHTDDRPINTEHYPSNWELSVDRATQVAKALMQMGLDPSRLSVKGFGEYRSLYPNDSGENRMMNRRVEIELSVPSPS